MKYATKIAAVFILLFSNFNVSISQLCNDWLTSSSCNPVDAFPLFYTRLTKTCWEDIAVIPSGFTIEIVRGNLWYAYDAGRGKMLKSIDKGITWTFQGYAIWESEYNGILLFRDDNIGYFTTLQNNLYKTLDGGKTWNLLFYNNNIPKGGKNSMDIEGNNIIVTYNEYAFFSTDGGATFNSTGSSITNGYGINKSLILDSSRAILQTNFNIYVTIDSGKTWRPLYSTTFETNDICKFDKTFYFVFSGGIGESKNGINWDITYNKNALNFLEGPLLVFRNDISNLIEMWIGNDYSISNGCLTNNYGFDNITKYKIASDKSMYLLASNVSEYKCLGEYSPHDVPFTARTINIANLDLTVTNENSSHGINGSNNPNCWISNSKYERPYWFHFKGNGKNTNIKIQGNDRIKVAIYKGYINCNEQVFCKESNSGSNIISTNINAENAANYFMVVDQNNLSSFNVKVGLTTNFENVSDNSNSLAQKIYYAEGKIYIRTEEIIRIELLDIVGKRVGLFINPGNSIINLEPYGVGMYLVKYFSNTKHGMKRIIHI